LTCYIYQNKIHHYNYFSSFYTLCTILMTIDWISYKIISTLEINYQSYQITQSIVQTLSVTLLLEHTLILFKTLSYYKNLHSYSTTIYILYNVIKRHFSSFIMKQINFRYIIIKNASIHKTWFEIKTKFSFKNTEIIFIVIIQWL